MLLQTHVLQVDVLAAALQLSERCQSISLFVLVLNQVLLVLAMFMRGVQLTTAIQMATTSRVLYIKSLNTYVHGFQSWKFC